MILPIYAYGQPVLRKKALAVQQDYQDMNLLIENMWETMYNANGIGLAAPQIGKAIRIFIVDTTQLEEDDSDLVGIRQVLINPTMLEENGEEYAYEEGCLSIPDIRGDVFRKSNIKIEFLNENFEKQTAEFSGINARVIQHEYDHIEGKLFTEKLQPLRKRMIKRKLESIKKGKVSAEYRMKFAL